MNLFAAAAFICCALVQLNDPDPWLWSGLYALAALISGIGVFTPVPGVLSGGLALLSAVWMLQLSPALWDVRFLELVMDAQMVRPQVEVAREFGGLGLVAFCMSLNALNGARRRSRHRREA